MMFKKILFFILLLLFLSPIYLFSWWHKQSLPVNPVSKETQIFVVPQGWGVEEIGQRLKEEGLVRNVLAFKIMVLKERINDKLQAGDFRLSPSMNLFEIAQTLTHGTLDVWVTIPEGLRREELALRLVDAFAEYGAEFDSLTFLNQTKNLEGFLFPDTYLIPKDATVEEVIKILKDNFEKKYASLNLDTNLTKQQIIILASLIEREAKHEQDRPIIAGILIKRLKKGWPLQVDASIQYGKANTTCSSSDLNCKWWPQISPDDLEQTNSLYNTYNNIGLPPTPICNAGLASFKAVINPQETEYWFYLSDRAGNSHYAKTLEEHEENIKNFLNP